jgi:uncharacterized BrkB/YihY/UPF0761 family membrane protein
MDTETMQDYRDKYRAQLLEYAKESQTSYDTTLITLAGGALGISFAFISQFIGDDPMQEPHLLAVSWICWVVTLALVLFSFATSTAALYRAVRQVDSEKLLAANPGGWFDRLTGILNMIAGVLFVGGVVAMAWFAFVNL